MSKITIKAMLKWLDGQRDAVNARIIASPPENQGRYMPELQVINAIAERVQEMTAAEFLKTLDAECIEHEGTFENGVGPCRECPFDGACIYGDQVDPRLSVERVKKWKEEQDAAD